MKNGSLVSVTIAALACGVAMSATVGTAAAQGVDIGKQEYETYCAVCHGKAGKGDGPFSGLVNKKVPDLTGLAKANGGVFPFDRAYEIISGQQGVAGHGTREMPIWGREYQAEAAQRYHEAHGQYDAQALVRARILLLIDYIGRMQVH